MTSHDVHSRDTQQAWAYSVQGQTLPVMGHYCVSGWCTKNSTSFCGRHSCQQCLQCACEQALGAFD